MNPEIFRLSVAKCAKPARSCFSALVLLVCMLAAAAPAFCAPPNNPAPSGDVLFFHAVSAGLGGDAFAYFKISDAPYTVKQGDALEFDVMIGKYSAEPKGSIDVQFADNGLLQDTGAADQFDLSMSGKTSLNIATGKWMHRIVSLDKVAGKSCARWFVDEQGGRQGDYFVAVDNIVVTNGGKIQAEIYREGAAQSAAPDKRAGYTLSRLKTVKLEGLDAELAKYATPDLLLGTQDADSWIKGKPDEAKYRDIIKTAKKGIDIDSCRAADEKKCSASLGRAFATLGPLSSLIKGYEMDYVGHAHIDMNWLWLWPETVRTTQATFTSVLKLMNEFPEFKFSQSQASLYIAMEEKFPELFEQIKQRVAEGRWELTGGSWVEGDLNMAAGESIVRSILYSKRYFKEKFGKEVEVLWEPDTFGHAWTIPQIMRKSGLKYYFFVRCGKGKPLFWWEGPDGSRVLALNGHSYGDSIQNSNADFLNEVESKEGLKIAATVYGVGDHGGGPTRADLDKAVELQKNPLYPEARFSFFSEFMDRIAAQSDKLPVVRDELNFTFRGCYTTHAEVKKWNRKSEAAMDLAETASSIAAQSGRPYNSSGFITAWRNIAFNQFHDIFDGSAIHDSYTYTNNLYKDAQKISDGETEGSLAYIGERIAVDKSKGIPVIVFNSLGWERTDPVEVTVALQQQPAGISVSDGANMVPGQILDVKEVASGVQARVLFMASGVPAAGYKTFYVSASAEAPKGGVTVGDDFIENKFFRVEIDRDKGIVSRIYDKTNSREVLPVGTGANVFQMLFEAPNGMSAWDIGEIKSTTDVDSGAAVSVAESGPVRAMLRIRNKASRSQFMQNVALYDGVPRIDFPCKVHWREVGNPTTGMYMLKVKFPVAVAGGKVAFEIPFGSIERPANGDEVPAQKWIDLSGADYGVSLLNDSKYGHDVKDNVMRLTLLRSSYNPDQLPDFGDHEFTYSLYPHTGDWKSAGTVRQGYDLNNPLAAQVIANTQPGAALPAQYSFLSVQPAALVVTAVKMSEDDNKRLIVRFYDSEGAGGKGNITFNGKVGNLKETDLMEREITPSRFKKNGGKYEFDYGKSEIITLSVEIGAGN